MAVFKGFASAISNESVFDIELVKQDLRNHLNTRKGERVMSPEYGNLAWDLLFELQSDAVVEALEEDIKRIIETDPRVELQELTTTIQEYGYTVDALLLFRGLDIVESLKIEFNKDISEASTIN